MSEPLSATRGRVVQFHYRINDASGREVETSHDQDPALALLGYGNLMPGLDAALLGRQAGEQFQVTLAPAEAYGERRDDLEQRISKKHFPKGTRFTAGVQVPLRTEQGVRTVTLLKIGNKFVDVDLNHPLAGETVTIELELLEVRDATPEEVAHRHAHGTGGHHH